MAPSVSGLQPVLELARRAGRAVLEVYARGRGGANVRSKDDRTPLTDADRVSHRILTAGLRELDPDTPVVSEEGDAAAGAADPAAGIPSGSRFWLVDPLDGTKEFLKRTGEFTVNVGLVDGGRVVAGVVHAPALERSWVGGVDGAVRVEGEGPGEERFGIGTRRAPSGPLTIAASRDHAGPVVGGLLNSLPDAEVLSVGSSLKFCFVAEGRVDLYLRDGPTMEWDTAAAQAVLEAAGGHVLTLEGAPLSYGKPALRNPQFVAVGDSELDWRTLLIRSRPPG